jgi:hypothetical protein
MNIKDSSFNTIEVSLLKRYSSVMSDEDLDIINS